MTPLALSEWRDFYLMIGTASGALVGATFIVVTLTAGVPNRILGIRGFISPTAVHLASGLVGSAILAVPNISALAVTLLLGAGGLMLAGSLLLLLIVGMRNAWDMASFMILRDPNKPDAPVE